ncbi:MAG: terpene cyclase/mutase family protein [Planctomycetes bacterium]|nr:terpene cyclase/mutase family protein [Planctomycetota bacterium]
MSPSRTMLALGLGALFFGPAVAPLQASGSSKASGLVRSRDGDIEELRKLRRERRHKVAEAAALKKNADDESRRKAERLQEEVEAVGKSIDRVVPKIIQALLKDLKSGKPEAVAKATAQLAEVGTPAVSELEKLATSGKGDEQARIQAVLTLIKLVEAGDDGLWSQWASGAKASSEYEGKKKKNTDDWSAIQACGAPDTETAGSRPTAWRGKTASRRRRRNRGEEWLELTYQVPVRPVRVRVHETFNPGAVVKIEAQDPETNWQVLWEGKDPTTEAPAFLDVPFDPPAYATRLLRVTLDMEGVSGMSEIDAVQLIGEPTGEAVTVKEITRADLLWEYFGPPPPKHAISKEEAVKIAVQELLKMQEKTGRWSYEAYHQDPQEKGGLPYGFQVGGTSIVGEALLLTAPDDKEVMAAVHRGLAWTLKALEHKKMTPRLKEAYDVRIWGHCYALQFLCRLRGMNKMGEYAEAVKEWIPKLVDTIIKEESPKGGWNYASRRVPASFVTSPMAQALMLAKSQGEAVPDELMQRTLEFLEACRLKDGSFYYGGSTKRPNWDGGGLPGSAGRAVVSESTLGFMGGSSPERIQFALDNFYRNWRELEKRRAKSGTHTGTYGIAPYYFYYAHRFLAQLIELLPEEKRPAERQRLFHTIMATRDDDGTWCDRYHKVHHRSRNVDTAFVLLAFLAEKAPLPPRLGKRIDDFDPR